MFVSVAASPLRSLVATNPSNVIDTLKFGVKLNETLNTRNLGANDQAISDQRWSEVGLVSWVFSIASHQKGLQLPQHPLKSLVSEE
ncbi:hypothetical protein V6N12_024467 [Hibiscus sabdariffa]|uniref:Uncharacterized protein n=1 Tax=Hibiscus sabdariffa TaxID=183260 RepID=A0ABR2G1D9_9ROSI